MSKKLVECGFCGRWQKGRLRCLAGRLLKMRKHRCSDYFPYIVPGFKQQPDKE